MRTSTLDPIEQEQIARRVVNAAAALQEALSFIPADLLETCRTHHKWNSRSGTRAVQKRWQRHREMEARRRELGQGDPDGAA
jgi:hypothetical protein